MATSSSNNPLKHLRSSDIRGLAQLATQATSGVTRIAEGVHQAVLNTLGVPGGQVPGETRGITGLVYKSIRGVNQWVGTSMELALSGLQPLLDSAEDEPHSSPRREAMIAALNGVMGDRLVKDDNPFATPMTVNYRGEALNLNAMPASPEAKRKVVLLIHGLCMNDGQWRVQGDGETVDHGEALASDLGYTPLYLRYNSGLHISQNGRELSALLEQLTENWPHYLEELAVVAHSMGGLLIRSACHHAREEGLNWPNFLKSIVFLGAPHHGAPLERAGNWMDVILGSTPFSAPFARLGHLRSAGITDLRYGHVLDQDWQGQDRFQLRPDDRAVVPLPEGIACHTVAATKAQRGRAEPEPMVGDGLVPLDSALGRHKDPQRNLEFASGSQWIAYQTSHLELLSSPHVTRQILSWLTPSPA